MKLGEVLAQQLALLPVRDTLLRTVVRTAAAADAFAATTEHARRWLSRKAAQFGLSVDDCTSFHRQQPDCRVDVERSAGDFAFAFEHADARETGRRWFTECVISDGMDRAEIDVRLSILRPQTAATPPRYTPEFLSDIAADIGLEDLRAVRGEPWFVGVDEVENLRDLLTSPERSLAVVAISQTGRGPLVSPVRAARRLLGVAHTVVLSEEASWTFTHGLGKEWSVFRGAVRRYAPGLRWTDDFRRHRFWLADSIQRADATAPSTGFLENLAEAIFAAATADFEKAIPLRTLRDVSRERMRADSLPALLHVDAPEASIHDIAQSANTATGVEPAVEPPELVVPVGDEAESDLSARIAELERDLQTERERADDTIRRRDEAIQGLQAKNAQLAEDVGLYQSLADEYAAESEHLRTEIRALRGEAGTYDGPMSTMLKTIAEALAQAHNVAKGVARRDEDLLTLRNDLATLEADRDELARQRFSLASRISTYQDRERAPASTAEGQPSYDEPDRFVDYVDARYAGRVVVSNAARKSFRNLVYLAPERLYETLDILGNEYAAMRLPQARNVDDPRSARRAFEERLRDMRLLHGPSATATGMGRNLADHVMVIEGRSLPCEKVRDISVTFDPQHFLCIYFVWDQQTERVVLKGFEHGETLNDHT